MRALVIGANGMDGSLMCELLVKKGYKVFAAYHNNRNLIDEINTDGFINPIHIDLGNPISISNAIYQTNPSEIYNFGGISFSPDADKNPFLTNEINYWGVMKIIEIVWTENIKFFQSSSSEVFGLIQNIVCDEKTKRQPHTPYAKAKNSIDDYMEFLRRTHKVKLYNAISFNHEGERRGEQFVSRKITKQVAEIAKGKRPYLEIGNIDSRRDWGYANDFVEAYHQIVLGDPDEFVVSYGKTHSVSDIIDISFKTMGIENYSKLIKVRKSLIRHDERNNITGNSLKLRSTLGWEPKTSFEEMITKMTQNDYALL